MGRCPICGFTLPQVQSFGGSGGLYACSNCLNPVVAERQGNEIVCRHLDGFPDVRHHLVAPVEISSRMLARLGSALEQVPAMPEIPRRVITMAHDPLSSLNEIASVISEDAVMTMKVLKLANSVFYAGVQEIASLDSACARVGLKMVLKIAHSVAGQSIYQSRMRMFQEPMEQAWQHSIATAYCAGEFATITSGIPTDEAFLAGLIHDVGRVVILDILGSLYDSLKLPQTDSMSTCLHVVASYRALVGLHVLQQWNLPVEFRVSTLCHIKPDTVPLADCARMTQIVSLADAVAEASGYGCESLENDPPIEDHTALEGLGLSIERLSEMRADLNERVDALLNVLAI